ncbi:hypothetical protein SAMN00808754_2030 [Thermanaeromonas toyohensis ToBE]|uniref:Uncharacterized protein n=1 Tax=Thermanaeromonas toyohensis ToBE TaxID=698762 RepID=A0A1W1VWM4_9FIRM|nr:hypothetical protein [Thermanaeromonas toyohensis]SMB97728.1 hypothetical protein SAMN00808754_1929 [Thermanaeromonas toyohensis ToBE]SMB97926.1 hypothetical protein SAMN00808754_2030 [Thermanaeromonas toyohensis ToBE]
MAGFDLLGGAQIKSIQRVNVQITSSGSYTASITAVDLGKTFLVIHPYLKVASEGYYGIRVYLSNSTTLVYEGFSYQSAYVYILEFASGISVQRGTGQIPAGATSANIAIAAVDPTKSFVTLSGKLVYAGSSYYGSQYMGYAYLTSSTNLLISRSDSTNAYDFAWEVVTLV